MPNVIIPTFPPITGLNWEPQDETAREEVYNRATPLKIHADADNAGYADDVYDTPGGAVNPRLMNYWPGQGPVSHSLRLRRFWRQVPGTFIHLPPGTQLRKSWQYTHGVSTTDSQSISVQMGFGAEGLSVGMSATFTHSITISDQQTQTTEFTVAPPPTGYTRVWVLWDLMYELAVLDANTGAQLRAGTYRGDVDFTDDKHYSGAYLNYNWTLKTISSGNLFPQSADFGATARAAG